MQIPPILLGVSPRGPYARSLGDNISPDQKQEPICIVDDDEWVADSLKLLLQTFGFDANQDRRHPEAAAQSDELGCL